ncbi:MAG: FAD-dependent oxidoreductase [Chitinophagales bacterium]
MAQAVQGGREFSAGQYDVVVAGGGTAGAVAAIAAARKGVSVLLLEQYGFLGGTATAGLVSPLMTAHVDGQPLVTGISAEIRQRLAAEGNAGRDRSGNDGWFNPEALKFVLEDLALEAGVELLYHSWVVGPVVDGQAVQGLFFESKSGRQTVAAKVVVDATGDADVAARAGAALVDGAEAGGRRQAMSLRFHLGNVNLGRFGAFLGQTPPLLEGAMIWGRGDALEPLFRQAVTDGVLAEEDGDYFQVFSVPGRPGELSFNCPRITGRVDATDVRDLSLAQVVGRRAVRRIVAFCRAYLPGCEDAYLVGVAPMVGVRESRRILGDYVLTLEDIREARKFPDAVARNNYPVDIHAATPGAPGGTLVAHLDPGAFYEIPYRCLLPRGLENLLVAGRCLSATFEAQSSVRTQLPVRALGQAAGTAAALAARRGVTPRQLEGTELRRHLVDAGMNL